MIRATGTTARRVLTFSACLEARSDPYQLFEGFADPASHYAETLVGLPQARKDRFFGGASAEMFKRMGDPLL